MSSTQAAAYLGVSPDTIRRWVKAGKLHPVEPVNPLLQRPKALRFQRADIERLKS
jgi:predicted site-specific integrase-resolvase